MFKKFLFTFLVLSAQYFLAQKVVSIDGFFITKTNDTVRTKFLAPTVSNGQYISNTTFLEKIYYSNDGMKTESIKEQDVKYLEYTDLQGKIFRLTSAANDPILENKKKLHLILVEGKISYYQTMTYDSYNRTVMKTDYLVRKDKNKIIRTGVFFTTTSDAFRELMGEFDMGRFFTKQNKLKTGNTNKIINSIIFYNSKYGGCNYVTSAYE